MNFIDKVKVFVAGGDGGDGCLSFLREKYREFGGPNGGDGGKGGDVVLEAVDNQTTLLEISQRPHLTAPPGGNGKGNNKHGHSGEDLVVGVPAGTVVYRDGLVVADLSEPGQRYLAASGGRGGRGNLSFKSRFNTAPRLCEKGGPGERATLQLELKLLADVGLVGFPNAGKSSLLARVSAARPKVADYPFTTLAPNLGVASHKNRSFVVADIPGLIEGAHAGKGLGTEFLRHVERTRVLVHLIDPAGFKAVDALGGIKKIEEELKSFSPRMLDKPRLLVVNKMDLPEGELALKAVSRRYRARRPLGISAATGQGVSELLDRILLELSRAGPPPVFVAAPDSRHLRIKAGFEVKPLGGGVFQLRGPFVERACAMLDASLPEAVDRFQGALKRIGVDRALKRAGIAEGDEVRCGSFSFSWNEKPYKPLHRLRRAHKRTRIGVGKNR